MFFSGVVRELSSPLSASLMAASVTCSRVFGAVRASQTGQHLYRNQTNWQNNTNPTTARLKTAATVSPASVALTMIARVSLRVIAGGLALLDSELLPSPDRSSMLATTRPSSG